MRNFRRTIALAFFAAVLVQPVQAQTAPSASEVAAYTGLFTAAHEGDLAMTLATINDGSDLGLVDSNGRTALHVAAFASHEDIVRLLADRGANLNALDHQAYDIITIAAVADDIEMMDLAISLGTDPKNITSPYDGTALIAAAHLGHAEIVEHLVKAGAPLDHINNLGWTAMIEVVVLGDGGINHVNSLRALLAGGANRDIADRQGTTPLQHAQARGYAEMVRLLQAK
jgi:hypothetical protein